MKRRKTVAEHRQDILRLAAGQIVINVFNYERLKQFTSVEHVKQLIDCSAVLLLVYVYDDAKGPPEIDPGIQALIDSEPKFQVRFLPKAQYDFQTEPLVVNGHVYMWEVTEDEPQIFTGAMANDLRLMCEGLLAQASVSI